MFTRETIKFLIPKSMLSLSGTSIADREVIPLYINPSNIQTSFTKNIQESQTIGGFIIQYWGDKITTINITGTTGSGGIEAINILYNKVYKSEQNSFRDIIIKRQSELAARIADAQSNATNQDAVSAASALDQILFNGAFSNLASGVGETMDFFRDSIAGNDVSKSDPVKLLPTLSAFAVSVDMHFQGRVHRGYIDTMSVTEIGASAGHFDYSMTFKSLKEFGQRNNFMPWHTNPRDASGRPKKKPTVGDRGYADNLSFPFTNAKETVSTSRSVSRVIDDQQGTADETGDPGSLIRFNKLR
jgi:hypothetical protein